MEDNKDKRVLRVELNDKVKSVTITGKDGEEKVVMRQELNEDDLEQATGGEGFCLSYKIGPQTGCFKYGRL